MLKFLLLALVAAIVWWAWRRGQEPAAKPPAERPAERMVTCAHCGVHLPESEALAADGRHYCNAAHREAGPGRP